MLRYPFVHCFEGVMLADAYPAYAFGAPENQTAFRKFFGVDGQSFDAALNLTMVAAAQCAALTGLDFT